MADSSQQLNFKDIDYTGIKEGLITFLQATDAFKDANFEGTFLNHLVSLFSYTGAIFGNYINAMTNEQYINTCNLYETGNMLGKLVGYKAHGFKAAKTSVTLTADFDSMDITDTLSNYYGWYAVLSRNTQFSTTKQSGSNKSLVFSNLEDTVLTIKDPSLSDSNVNEVSLELIQGIPLSIEYTSDGTSLQSFEIPNPFVDWSNIRVYVENDENEEELWESALTFFNYSSSSKVYIPYINPKGLLEVLFAEGNFGKIPESGRTIRIEYYATQGAVGTIGANMINSLIDSIYFVNPSDTLQQIQAEFTISQPNESTVGENIETLERIKEFAPLYYGIQNRLVNHFDYENYVLGEYSFLVDAKVYNYEEAVEVGLLKSPCENLFVNKRWATYTEQTVVGEDDPIKIPTKWDFQNIYQYYTVDENDTLPLPKVSGSLPAVEDMLNFGTDTALFVDTTRPCEDEKGGLISQKFVVDIPDECCNYVVFEAEVMNPEINQTTGLYPEITADDIELYINAEKCFLRVDSFTYNSNGYVSNECCCDREGDVIGWYTVKGVYLIDKDSINSDTDKATLLGSVYVQPNKNLLIGEVKVYPKTCLNANDIFIVPVPENGGYLSIEQKETILEDLDEINMVNVRDHIIAPIYQTFDVRVIFKKDEASLISLEDVRNAIKTSVISYFLPANQELGSSLNTLDIANELNDIQGVERARVILTPRSIDMVERVNELGDYELKSCEFPILGTINIS